MILAYFTEGIVRAWSDKGLSAALAMGETALSLILFLSVIIYIRAGKNAATVS
jgi:uncharacterized membrane protein